MDDIQKIETNQGQIAQSVDGDQIFFKNETQQNNYYVTLNHKTPSLNILKQDKQLKEILKQIYMVEICIPTFLPEQIIKDEYIADFHGNDVIVFYNLQKVKKTIKYLREENKTENIYLFTEKCILFFRRLISASLQSNLQRLHQKYDEIIQLKQPNQKKFSLGNNKNIKKIEEERTALIFKRGQEKYTTLLENIKKQRYEDYTILNSKNLFQYIEYFDILDNKRDIISLSKEDEQIDNFNFFSCDPNDQLYSLEYFKEYIPISEQITKAKRMATSLDYIFFKKINEFFERYKIILDYLKQQKDITSIDIEIQQIVYIVANLYHIQDKQNKIYDDALKKVFKTLNQLKV